MRKVIFLASFLGIFFYSNARKIATLPQEALTAINYYFDKEKKEEYYNALISTLKYENEKLYRLQSFEILPEVKKSSAIKNISQTNTSDNNPLNNGTIYKIKVDKSGIFKITSKFLKDNGINPANINPKNFKIYGNGGLMLPEDNRDNYYKSLQEIAIEIKGEEDGKWDDEDYALFYAQGANGFNVYSGNQFDNGTRRTETRTDRPLNFQNIYEDNAYYFIKIDASDAHKRLEESNIAPPTNLITRYDDYQYINEEKNNLLKVGRVWVGDAISGEKTITFNTKSAIQPTDNIYYRFSAVGLNSSKNSISINLNNNVKSSSFGNDFSQVTITDNLQKLSGNTLSFKISPDSSTNPAGSAYIDYLEVVYKEDLKFNGTQMNFRDYSISETESDFYGFSISNTSGLEEVWDISDITNAKKIVNKSGNSNYFNFGYQTGKIPFNNEFVAFNNSAAYTPSFVGKIANQDLSSLQNIDYLIITQNSMMAEAKRLADYHTEKDAFKTAIVDVNQIYNEFSSGSKDITGIRNFISKLKNENGGLKYVLLIGDTSYDFKDKTSGNDNIIPAYESEASNNYTDSFVSDDYFVMTEEQTSSTINLNLPDIPIGRLPASNPSEAKAMINKILAYNNNFDKQSNPFGDWRMNMDFVVDDDSDGNKAFHKVVDDILSSEINDYQNDRKLPEYHLRKLYIDAFTAENTAGGQRFPIVNQSINSAMNNSLFLFYFGHGGPNGWADERILTPDQISSFNNYNKLFTRFPFVTTITCEFTLWDVPNANSTGENLFKHKQGGANTMITSSRAIGINYGVEFSKLLLKEILTPNGTSFNTLGDAHLTAKTTYGANADHFKVNFLGDPAMRLSRALPNIVIDKIETPNNGEIRGLDFVKITGHINKKDNSGIDENFNGKVTINLFDKPADKKTKNNDGKVGVMDYKEENAPIVKTSTNVEKGSFTLEFYTPKDIDLTVGDGRIMLYAENFSDTKDTKKTETDKRNAWDAYLSKPQKIGGINPNPNKDNQAPKINLYMNNTNFVDGGITNQNPVLLACISDDIGINSTGSGIGHDMTVVLDGQVANTTIINDFYSGGEGNGCFSADLKDYQKGSLAYPLKNLSAGQHQLVVKVWDINNNSSTASLNFVVKDQSNEKLQISRLLNWPNPFTNKTYIQFEHNCDDILDVTAQIYTITGKLVKTIKQTITAEPYLQGFRTPKDAIEWDGTDDYGDSVGKGTYIYKVFVKANSQDKCKGSATGVEKMLILK